MSIEDYLMVLDYKMYSKLRDEGEEKRRKELKEKNKINPASISSLEEKFSSQDILFLSSLVDFFFEETPQKLWEGFLEDNCYTEEEYIRLRNKIRRMEDFIKLGERGK